MVCSFLGSRVVVVGFLILVSFLFILCFYSRLFGGGGLELILITVCLGLLVDKLFGFSCYYLCRNSQSILRRLPNEDESVGIQIFAGLTFSGFWGCVCLGFRKIDWFCVFFVGKHLLLYPLLVCCCFLVDFVVD